MEKGSGTRSGLLWEVERILNECDELPQVLLMENVTQVHSKKNIDHFKQWINFLESKGYSNYWKDINAKDFGIPQNRNRCFMVSILGNYNYKFPKPFELKSRLKDMLEDEVDEKYYLNDEQIKKINESTYTQNKRRIQQKEWCDTLCARDYKDPKCVEVNNEPKIEVAFNLYDMGVKGFNRDTGDVMLEEGLCKTIQTMQGGNRQPKILVPEATKKGYAEAYEGDGVYINRPHQKRGTVQNGMIQTLKTSGNDVGVVVSEPKIIDDAQGFDGVREYESYSPTLRATRSGLKVEHNLRIRKLTPLECWRLMGFDDEDFYKAEKVNSNTQLYKQAGNSIVVNVLEEMFEKLF